MPIANSWDHAYRLARKHGHDAEIKLPKDRTFGLPSEYEPSSMSIPKGANNVYRSPGPGEHFQVREYDDHYTVDLDHHHPKDNAIGHVIKDGGKYTVAGAAVTIAAASRFG